MPNPHPELYPFPEQLPPTGTVIAVVVDALRDREVDFELAYHCAWHIAGYAGSKWHRQFGSADAPRITAEECAQYIEQLIPGSVIGDPTAFPWAIVVPIIIELIKFLWERRSEPFSEYLEARRMP